MNMFPVTAAVKLIAGEVLQNLKVLYVQLCLLIISYLIKVPLEF